MSILIKICVPVVETQTQFNKNVKIPFYISLANERPCFVLTSLSSCVSCMENLLVLSEVPRQYCTHKLRKTSAWVFESGRQRLCSEVAVQPLVFSQKVTSVYLIEYERFSFILLSLFFFL